MDLVPNEGAAYYTPPVDIEQKRKEREEKGRTLEALPMVEGTVDWLEKQAQEFEKITNLDRSLDIPMESQVLAYSMAAQLFRTKKGELRTFLEAYDPKKK